MLKTALFDCAINEKCWRRTGPLPLFFCPHPGGLGNSRVPTPGNLPSKARTMLMPEGNWLMHNQHYISLLLWWDVDTKALKNKTHIPLSQSVAILFPQFEQNLLVSCLLCPQFEQNVLFTFCLPTKMATTSGRRNVLRKLLRISYRRLKAGFFVCWRCWPCSTVFVCWLRLNEMHKVWTFASRKAFLLLCGFCFSSLENYFGLGTTNVKGKTDHSVSLRWNKEFWTFPKRRVFFWLFIRFICE